MNRRLVGGALAIVLLVSGAGFLAFRGLFDRSPEVVKVQSKAEPVPVVALEKAQLEAVVVATEGVVEKQGVSGTWKPVAVGDKLIADDQLRTDPAGRAELSVGGGSVLTVAASTELKVRELSPALHQLQLKRGRLAAKYDADGRRVLEIQDENGKTVAVTRGAKFSILASGQAMAVATETGIVTLKAAGAEVEVGPGQQAHSYQGAAPSPVTPIRAEVLLKIARGKVDPSLCANVVGTVEAGAEVRLEGELLVVDAAGGFSAKVPRVPGRNSVRLAVRDASGRPRETVVACLAPEADPNLKLDLRWAPDPE